MIDKQWVELEPLLKSPRSERHAGGSPRAYALRRVDGGYTGTFIDWVKEMFEYRVKVEVALRSDQKGFNIFPKCWIVEGTFAWLNWSGRLFKGDTPLLKP